MDKKSDNIYRTKEHTTAKNEPTTFQKIEPGRTNRRTEREAEGQKNTNKKRDGKPTTENRPAPPAQQGGHQTRRIISCIQPKSTRTPKRDKASSGTTTTTATHTATYIRHTPARVMQRSRAAKQSKREREQPRVITGTFPLRVRHPCFIARFTVSRMNRDGHT